MLSSFPTMFSYCMLGKFNHLSSLIGHEAVLTLSETMPGFYMSAVHCRKHCGKGRKCSWAISPFSSVFYPFGELDAIFMKIGIVVCKLPLRVLNLMLGKGLTLSQTTNFRLFQTQSVCRLQFRILLKWRGKFSKWVENAVGKGEIACYKQFHLFPQCFL